MRNSHRMIWHTVVPSLLRLSLGDNQDQAGKRDKETKNKQTRRHPFIHPSIPSLLPSFLRRHPHGTHRLPAILQHAHGGRRHSHLSSRKEGPSNERRPRRQNEKEISESTENDNERTKRVRKRKKRKKKSEGRRNTPFG